MNEIDNIDIMKNDFMNLIRNIDISYLKNNLNKYIIVRYLDKKKLKDYIKENVFILKNVENNKIIVLTSKNDEQCISIDFNRIMEYEILNNNLEIINKLNKLDFSNYNYLVEITNIYDRKIKVIVNYITSIYDDGIDESDNIIMNYKYSENNNIKYGLTEYQVGLIKDIKVLEKYNIKSVNEILNYVSLYYKYPKELISEIDSDYNKEKLSIIINLIKKIVDISDDCLAINLNCKYYIIKNSIDKTNKNEYPNKINLNYEDIKEYLDYYED